MAKSKTVEAVELTDEELAIKKKKKEDKKKKRKEKLLSKLNEREEQANIFDVQSMADEIPKVSEKASDGKKSRLSNKERKRLKEEKLKQERHEEYTRAAHPMDGSQFSVSQQAFHEDATWENALDIHIDDFTINAHSKLLFENASLHINHGNKYGLIGANGQGKSTILKMIALGELKIPPKVWRELDVVVLMDG